MRSSSDSNIGSSVGSNVGCVSDWIVGSNVGSLVGFDVVVGEDVSTISFLVGDVSLETSEAVEFDCEPFCHYFCKYFSRFICIDLIPDRSFLCVDRMHTNASNMIAINCVMYFVLRSQKV